MSKIFFICALGYYLNKKQTIALILLFDSITLYEIMGRKHYGGSQNQFNKL